MAGGRLPVCLPPAAAPGAVRAPLASPGARGGTLNRGASSAGAAASPGSAGSLTDSRSPRRAGGLKGEGKVTPSRRRRRSLPLEGEAAGPRRRQQLGGGRRLRGRSPRVSFPPRCPERDSAEEVVAPCRAGRCRKFAESAGGREEGAKRKKKKNLS